MGIVLKKEWLSEATGVMWLKFPLGLLLWSGLNWIPKQNCKNENVVSVIGDLNTKLEGICVSLPITLNWEELLTPLRKERPWREIFVNWIVEQSSTLWSLTRASAGQGNEHGTKLSEFKELWAPLSDIGFRFCVAPHGDRSWILILVGPSMSDYSTIL